jgi:hypothetical protein
MLWICFCLLLPAECDEIFVGTSKRLDVVFISLFAWLIQRRHCVVWGGLEITGNSTSLQMVEL